jgi:hypothetical protein
MEITSDGTVWSIQDLEESGSCAFRIERNISVYGRFSHCTADGKLRLRFGLNMLAKIERKRAELHSHDILVRT